MEKSNVDGYDNVKETSNGLIDEQNGNEELNEDVNQDNIMEDFEKNAEESFSIFDNCDTEKEADGLIDEQKRNEEMNEVDVVEERKATPNLSNNLVKEELENVTIEVVESDSVDSSWKNHNLRKLNKKKITYVEIEEHIENEEEDIIIVKKKPPKIDDGRFHCDICTKAFSTKKGLVLHKRFHKKIEKFTCSYCQQTFENNEDLRSHKEVHVAEKIIYKCLKCELAFSDHCEWLKHNIEHTRKNQYFNCIECGVSFKTRKACHSHIPVHFNNDYPCTKCDKVFRSEAKRDLHVKSHSEQSVKKSFECGECGKLFSDGRALKRHLYFHAGVFNCQCLHCGKGFYTDAARTIHTRIHTGERPYGCKICGDSFKQEGERNKHLRTHDVEKKYQCDICQKKFYHKESMASHIRAHMGLNKYECKICSKKFPHFANLRIHTLYCHVNEKTFKCDTCEMSFKTSNCLRKHIHTIKHKNKEYEMSMIKK